MSKGKEKAIISAIIVAGIVSFFITLEANSMTMAKITLVLLLTGLVMTGAICEE